MINAFAMEALDDDMPYLMQAYQTSLNPGEAESLSRAIELLKSISHHKKWHIRNSHQWSEGHQASREHGNFAVAKDMGKINKIT